MSFENYVRVTALSAAAGASNSFGGSPRTGIYLKVVNADGANPGTITLTLPQGAGTSNVEVPAGASMDFPIIPNRTYSVSEISAGAGDSIYLYLFN
jgi:hypothetical protein